MSTNSHPYSKEGESDESQRRPSPRSLHRTAQLQSHEYSARHHRNTERSSSVAASSSYYPARSSRRPSPSYSRRSRSRSRSRSPSRSPSRRPRSSRRSRPPRSKQKSVGVWLATSYQNLERGFIVGLGLQFDNSLGQALHTAFSWPTPPSSYADILACILSLAVLKMKNMDHIDVKIYSNTVFLSKLMDEKAINSKTLNGVETRLYTFLADIINERPGQVRMCHTSSYYGPKSPDYMLLAKHAAASVRKQIKIPNLPSCLWTSPFGQQFANIFNTQVKSFHHERFEDALHDTESSIIPARSSLPPPPRRSSPPPRRSSPPPRRSSPPPPQTRPTLPAPPTRQTLPAPSARQALPAPSTRQSLPAPPTQTSNPPHWPSDLPYPVPFELASNLITKLMAITAPPTPDELLRLSNDQHLLPRFDPIQPQSQQPPPPLQQPHQPPIHNYHQYSTVPPQYHQSPVYQPPFVHQTPPTQQPPPAQQPMPFQYQPPPHVPLSNQTVYQPMPSPSMAHHQPPAPYPMGQPSTPADPRLRSSTHPPGSENQNPVSNMYQSQSPPPNQVTNVVHPSRIDQVDSVGRPNHLKNEISVEGPQGQAQPSPSLTSNVIQPSRTRQLDSVRHTYQQTTPSQQWSHLQPPPAAGNTVPSLAGPTLLNGDARSSQQQSQATEQSPPPHQPAGTGVTIAEIDAPILQKNNEPQQHVEQEQQRSTSPSLAIAQPPPYYQANPPPAPLAQNPGGMYYSYGQNLPTALDGVQGNQVPQNSGRPNSQLPSQP